jgi:hypothetical protein
MSEENEENHEEPQSKQLMTGLRFEPDTGLQ